MKAETWDEQAHGPLSEAAIRELHRPPEVHRISPYSYDSGVQFSGWMNRGRVYVLEGRCRYSFSSGTVEPEGGHFCDLDKGDFEFRVLGAEPCSLVLVWDLSGFFRSVDGRLLH